MGVLLLKTTMAISLLAAWGGAAAELAIPNPTRAPILTGAPPMPAAPRGNQSAVDISGPSSLAAPGGATSSSASVALSGLYVSAVMGGKAVLRGNINRATAPGMAGGLQPMVNQPGAQGGAQGGVQSGGMMPVQRQISVVVRDGEPVSLLDDLDLMASVKDGAVILYQIKAGSRFVVYRGQLDSITPQAGVTPLSASLQSPSQAYIDSLSTKTGGAGGGATNTAAPAAAGANSTPPAANR